MPPSPPPPLLLPYTKSPKLVIPGYIMGVVTLGSSGKSNPKPLYNQGMSLASRLLMKTEHVIHYPPPPTPPNFPKLSAKIKLGNQARILERFRYSVATEGGSIDGLDFLHRHLPVKFHFPLSSARPGCLGPPRSRNLRSSTPRPQTAAGMSRSRDEKSVIVGQAAE